MYELQLQEEKRCEGMILTIRCDKCGADCTEYKNRVAVNFPYWKQYDLCIKCAREILPSKEEREVKE